MILIGCSDINSSHLGDMAALSGSTVTLLHHKLLRQVHFRQPCLLYPRGACEGAYCPALDTGPLHDASQMHPACETSVASGQLLKTRAVRGHTIQPWTRAHCTMPARAVETPAPRGPCRSVLLPTGRSTVLLTMWRSRLCTCGLISQAGACASSLKSSCMHVWGSGCNDRQVHQLKLQALLASEGWVSFWVRASCGKSSACSQDGALRLGYM